MRFRDVAAEAIIVALDVVGVVALACVVGAAAALTWWELSR